MVSRVDRDSEKPRWRFYIGLRLGKNGGGDDDGPGTVVGESEPGVIRRLNRTVRPGGGCTGGVSSFSLGRFGLSPVQSGDKILESHQGRRGPHFLCRG